MFLHYGMNTFSGGDTDYTTKPQATYAPHNLDVDQWMRVARDAGMKYAVLTAKHHTGHCLWPSRHTDYHVGNTPVPTDVVRAFVEACRKYGLVPGLYYASWDEHHEMGSLLPSVGGFGNAYTSALYREFQMAQVEELLTEYGPLGEFWVDIPGFLGAEGRHQQYRQIARLQPDCLVNMNQGFSTGESISVQTAWPTDLCSMERQLPSRPLSGEGFNPWYTLDIPGVGIKDYYIPGEVCDTIGRNWFHHETDLPRSDAELLGMRLICRERGANFLLNVPPDASGQIPMRFVEALMRLKQNLDAWDSAR